MFSDIYLYISGEIGFAADTKISSFDFGSRDESFRDRDSSRIYRELPLHLRLSPPGVPQCCISLRLPSVFPVLEKSKESATYFEKKRKRERVKRRERRESRAKLANARSTAATSIGRWIHVELHNERAKIRPARRGLNDTPVRKPDRLGRSSSRGKAMRCEARR